MAAENDDDRPARRVDEVLTVELWWLEGDLTGKRRRRLRQAAEALRECVEVHGQRAMGEEDLRLLEFERQFFDPAGSVGRVASAEVLLRVLPAYLEEPRWQGTDDEDRRVRMRMAWRLARSVARLPELEGFETAPMIEAVRQAWKVANRRLRRDQWQRALERMTPERRARMEETMAQIEARFGAASRDSREA